MPPRPLVYANALGIDPHIQALFAAFSEDRPPPGTDPHSVTPPLTPPYQRSPVLPGVPLRRIISISDSDDEAPPPPERRAGKKPQQLLEDATSGVTSRKVSFPDPDLDAMMRRIHLDGEGNGKSTYSFESIHVLIYLVVRAKSPNATAGPSRSHYPPSPAPTPFSDPPSPARPTAARLALPSTPTRAKPPPKTYNVASPSRTGNVPTWPLAGHLTQGVPGAHVQRTANEIQARTGPRSPRKPRSLAYTIFQGLQVGIFEKWYI